MPNLVFFQPLVLSAALAEQMRLDLIDRWHDLVEFDQVDQPVWLEVRHADGAKFPLSIQFFQRPSGRVIVAEGPVAQHQIDGIGLPLEDTLRARYQIILRQRAQAHRRVEEARATAAYMDEKVRHYEQILAGVIPDDSNPSHWTAQTRPEKHESPQ